jgi:hypothetical protein
MPVPAQDRDDGSGIQLRNTLIKKWIPGQARNDKNSNVVSFANCDTPALRMVVDVTFIGMGLPVKPLDSFTRSGLMLIFYPRVTMKIIVL